ncbi:hypothetical protein [Fluviispira multicolorata]|uniref:Uncharacterized protein n=1 Tax=Fluviispira multicolorata TaxID=2654512 RepID=A0A833JCV9_9BACT|nr:hypothetical protein [Fluviispira multicolorata]KAB8029877.1 hypothetical protein GCL57_10085 [Fluviispira multicolorata]
MNEVDLSKKKKSTTKWAKNLFALNKDKKYSLEMLSKVTGTKPVTIRKYLDYWEIYPCEYVKKNRTRISLYDPNDITKGCKKAFEKGKNPVIFSQDIFMAKVRLFVKLCNHPDKEYFEDILS